MNSAVEGDELCRGSERCCLLNVGCGQAPADECFQEIALVGCFAGHEVADKIEDGRGRGMAQERALPDSRGVDVVIVLDENAL